MVKDPTPSPMFECERAVSVTSAQPAYAKLSDNICFISVREGVLFLQLNLMEYTVRAGELLAINSNEFFSIRALEGTAVYDRIAFSTKLLSVFLTTNKFLSQLKSNLLLKEYRHFSADFLRETQIHEILREILDTYEEKSMFYELIAAGKILQVSGTLCNHIAGNAGENSLVNGKGDMFCENAREILKYTNKNFTLCDERKVAEHFGLSYSYFSRTFKKAIGVTYTEYVNFLKVNEAKRLLCETDTPVQEIAEQLSFSTPSHLINVFKKFTGVSPRQYRKSFSAAV